MAGCAMIGQSGINVKSGGKGRLSTLVAGAFLMFLIIVLGDLLVQIPMAALVGVMFMVSIGTFDWSSVKNLHKLPRTDAVVMLTTVCIVLVTHDLSKGVLAGVLLSAIFFAAKISKVKVTDELVQKGTKRIYYVQGQLFFASVNDFVKKFEYADSVKEVEINLTNAHLWDDSAIGALDKIEMKFEQHNIRVYYTGLNDDSEQLMKRIGGLSRASGE